MKILILITTILLIGCSYKVKAPIQPLSFIETYPLDTTKIRYDGYYNNISDSVFIRGNFKYTFPKNKTTELVVFNKNKFIYIDSGATIDETALSCEYYQKIETWYKTHNEDYLGYFTIKNDSIYAYTITTIGIKNGAKTAVFCNHRGFIKNRDTITDWKVIPPYPKDFTKFVIEKNQWLFKSKTLYFVKTDAVKCLQMD
ncbi:hypothetical protein [Flavobacterium sp.]|uniref:hypothetical protein n=1 Tax=Flavobacterium sp. TaxID=239 RepID=UPI002623F8D5|nr:hypothetical protein [Flavobacterium sp.]